PACGPRRPATPLRRKAPREKSCARTDTARLRKRIASAKTTVVLHSRFTIISDPPFPASRVVSRARRLERRSERNPSFARWGVSCGQGIAEEATRPRQRQWCCASMQVAPAGQSPGSALHTSVRTGAPFARRSTTLRPQGPGVWSVRQLPHVGDTEVVEGFRPSSTQAVRACRAGVHAARKRQMPPGRREELDQPVRGSRRLEGLAVLVL